MFHLQTRFTVIGIKLTYQVPTAGEVLSLIRTFKVKMAWLEHTKLLFLLTNSSTKWQFHRILCSYWVHWILYSAVPVKVHNKIKHVIKKLMSLFTHTDTAHELVSCTYTHSNTNLEGQASTRHLHVVFALPFCFTNAIPLVYKSPESSSVNVK